MSGDDFKVDIKERGSNQDGYIRPAILNEDSQSNASGDSNAEDNDDSAASGSDSEEESSEDDAEEDENAELLTPNIDQKIFQTIAAIRTKDPRVYNTQERFFNEDDVEKARKEWNAKKDAVKDKKIKLKDYERQILLEDGGYVEEPTADDAEEFRTMTHVEEQEALKQAFKKAAFKDIESEEEGDEAEDDDLFTKKKKTREELKAEEEDYKTFLLKGMASDKGAAEAFKNWHNYKNSSEMSSDDAFLIDYVLNRGWVNKQKEEQNDLESDSVPLGEVDQEDDEYLDDADRFESKYNFRFEEAEGAQIISYPRHIEGSVRQNQSKRSRQREKERERAAVKKEQKTEELKRLKNQKRKEIHERLSKIKEITGANANLLDELDIDGDFDPETYDKVMAKIFDEEHDDEKDDDDLGKKPTWDDDDEEEEEAVEKEDDEEIMMDADYLPGGDKYVEKKRKNSSKPKITQADRAMAADKIDEYRKLMDEYYNLNYEDIIGGDLPTRFKYVETVPENFGLSAVDILLADDNELDHYMNPSYLAPYRRRDPYAGKGLHKRAERLRNHINDKLKTLNKEDRKAWRKKSALRKQQRQFEKRKRDKRKTPKDDDAENENEDDASEKQHKRKRVDTQ